MDHHTSKRDLVKVVVENLSQWTAVVRSACLLSVDRIDCLIPEISEPGEKEDPARECLSESGINHADCDKGEEGENKA